jgi:hypothetical protein
MWIAYDGNDLGASAAWVDARRKFWVLPRRSEGLIKQMHLPPEPAPLRPQRR